MKIAYAEKREREKKDNRRKSHKKMLAGNWRRPPFAHQSLPINKGVNVIARCVEKNNFLILLSCVISSWKTERGE